MDICFACYSAHAGMVSYTVGYFFSSNFQTYGSNYEAHGAVKRQQKVDKYWKGWSGSRLKVRAGVSTVREGNKAPQGTVFH